jgi:glutaredoxin
VQKSSPSKKPEDSVVVYGTKRCPWTVKQLKYLDEKSIDHEFKDCSQKGECPKVEGFPTLRVGGKMLDSGYQEI